MGLWEMVCGLHREGASVVFLALIIICTKKTLNSDWLRKECEMCNMSAKCVIQYQCKKCNTVQISH